MRFFGFFRRNRRWERQVDAHVDGRLTAVERALLAERLDESPAVRQTLEESLAIKRALRAMPEQPPPRSFALTDAMLADVVATPPPAPRRARVTMRLSQVTAFAAIAAFGLLVAVDLSGAGEHSTTPAASETTLSATAADDADKAGDGAVAPEVAPQPTGGAGETEDTQRATTPGSFYDQASPAADMTTIALAAEDPGERDYRPLYASLAGVLALAVAAWAVSRHQLGRVLARSAR